MLSPSRFENWICLLALAVVVLVPLLSPNNPPNFTDWQVYIKAAHKMSEGKTVYDVVGHYQYKYAPVVAAVFAGLLKVFSASTLGWINWGLELLLFWALYVYFADTSSLRIRPFKSFAMLVLGVSCLAITLRDELKLGQLNLWCLWFMIGAWFCSERSRVKMAALLWVTAVSIKLYALILLPYWIFRREWKLLASSLVAYLVLSLGLLVPWIGLQEAINENIAWLSSLTRSSSELSGSTFDVSLLGSLQKIGLPYSTAIVFWGVILFAYLREAWTEANYPHPDRLRFFGRSIAWTVLLNPLVWPYWYLLLSLMFFASYQNPSRFSGSVAVPRLGWWVFCAIFLIAIHRSSTPVGTSGILAGLLGAFLMLRPKSVPS